MKKRIHTIMNHEYLMTNGLGGYSFGTLDGVNCRKYHSLLTVSLSPPVQRLHMVSKCEEVVEMDGVNYPMTFENTIGSDTTESFQIGYAQKGILEQTFSRDGISIKRRLAMCYGSNQLTLVYDCFVPEAAVLKLTPFFNFRDHHDTETPDIEWYRIESRGDHRYEIANDKYSLFMASEGNWIHLKGLSAESYYPIETDRGYPDVEQHVILGYFSYPLQAGENTVVLQFNTKPTFLSPESILEGRIARYHALQRRAGFEDPRIKRLVQAADDFIVMRKSTCKRTILAGYPWFTDWGRDTMIALPGLTLSTQRYDEGLEMIEGFIAYANRGIIPNNFPDEGQPPMYNTADGTLWLFNAVYQYYDRTGDKEAIRRLFPELLKIIKHHIVGTINDIYMDEDGLLSTGNEATQLTWMDVKVNDWVVTPRHGKAVEINALWYNALCTCIMLAGEIGAEAHVDRLKLTEIAERCRVSFNRQFVNVEKGRLYDLVIDGEAVDIPRPNMIFALSLPFAVLDSPHHKMVVDYVREHFKVPYGLLTLEMEDPDFKGDYKGDLLSRDGAYHRGTAWGWLLGPYFEAHYKTYGDKDYIRAELEVFFAHLDEGIHGSVSEIFEGKAPHAQKGCSAQAWSVAEVIRIWDALKLDQ